MKEITKDDVINALRNQSDNMNIIFNTDFALNRFFSDCAKDHVTKESLSLYYEYFATFALEYFNKESEFKELPTSAKENISDSKKTNVIFEKVEQNINALVQDVCNVFGITDADFIDDFYLEWFTLVVIKFWLAVYFEVAGNSYQALIQHNDVVLGYGMMRGSEFGKSSIQKEFDNYKTLAESFKAPVTKHKQRKQEIVIPVAKLIWEYDTEYVLLRPKAVSLIKELLGLTETNETIKNWLIDNNPPVIPTIIQEKTELFGNNIKTGTLSEQQKQEKKTLLEKQKQLSSLLKKNLQNNQIIIDAKAQLNKL